MCRQYPGLSSRNGLNLTRACRHKVIVQSAEDHSVIAEKTTDASGILVFDVPAGRYLVLGFGDQPATITVESGRAVKLKLVVH